MKKLLNLSEILDEDVYNLSPIDYELPFKEFENALQNFWSPKQIPMGGDLDCFKKLSENERELFLNVFATLTTSDLVIQQNLVKNVYEVVAPPEIRLFLGAQIFYESLHSYSYQHCIEILSLNDADVYLRYKKIPEIGQKFTLANKYGTFLLSQNVRKIFLGLFFYYAIFEGVWFYHGFSPIFSLKRRNLMTGTSEQLEYIARDESQHFTFGLWLLNEIKRQHLDSETFRMLIPELHDICEQTLQAEEIYACRCIPTILGYSADLHISHMKWLLNLRLKQIGAPGFYLSEKLPPIPWLDEIVATKKEKNFFETHVSDYRTGGLSWD